MLMMTEIDRLGENISEIADFKFHEIQQLPSCTYMNLHCNCLRHLEGLPHKLLIGLTELNLSSNDFTSCYLPELSYLPSLRILDLSANKLESVIDLPFLPGLESLLVAYNLLTQLDGLEENVPNLRKLDVSIGNV
jgi:Leucine-rich repeat (LRR) protein